MTTASQHANPDTWFHPRQCDTAEYGPWWLTLLKHFMTVPNDYLWAVNIKHLQQS